jgi:hypothetical protein
MGEYRKRDAVPAREGGERSDIEMEYYTVQPNRWSFQSRKIRRWVEKHLRGRVLNACAGKTHLTHDHEIVRNDIDRERDADLHVDVCEISDHFDAETFDTVVYDPPFTSYQATRTYDGKEVGDDGVAKQEFDRLLRPGGRVIQLGYSTTCMPMSLGYPRQAVAVFNTLGRMNDYLGTVDEHEAESSAEPNWFRARGSVTDE